MAHARVLDREKSVLVVVDVQEGYRNKTVGHDRMVRGVCRLVRAANELEIPILATEQYPNGLGHLQSEVLGLLPKGLTVIEKMSMSCMGQPLFRESLSALGRPQVVVCGIEAHACVNQTAHDLLDAGYAVHLPFDALSSRFAQDYEVGLHKMVGSGAVPTSVETVCLEWIRTAESPHFKAIHRIIK